MRDDVDRAAIAAFVKRHGLSYARLAAHAGIPLSTLTAIMGAGRRPYPATRDKLMAAIIRPPPPKPLPRHHETVTRYWDEKKTSQIAEMIGITEQGVRSIARRIGLPSKRNAGLAKDRLAYRGSAQL